MGTHLILKFHGSSKFTQCGNIFLEIEANQQFDHDHLIRIKRKKLQMLWELPDNIFETHFNFILPKFPTSPTHTHTHTQLVPQSLYFLDSWDNYPLSAHRCSNSVDTHSSLFAPRPRTMALHCCCLSSMLTLGTPFRTQEITPCSSP